VGTYIIRRVIAMILMLVALSIIVFLLFQALPGNPAALTCGKSCTPQVIKQNEIRLDAQEAAQWAPTSSGASSRCSSC
jgi:peptide/nickel transport system permease protein